MTNVLFILCVCAVAIIVALAAFAWAQREQVREIRESAKSSATELLFRLYTAGQLSKFGYGIERFESEHEYLDLTYVCGPGWEYYSRSGAGHENLGPIPLEVEQAHTLIRLASGAFEEVLDTLAERIGEQHSRLFVVKRPLLELEGLTTETLQAYRLPMVATPAVA